MASSATEPVRQKRTLGLFRSADRRDGHELEHQPRVARAHPDFGIDLPPDLVGVAVPGHTEVKRQFAQSSNKGWD